MSTNKWRIGMFGVSQQALIGVDVSYESPGAGFGYLYFDNSAGLLSGQPLENLLLTFTDASGLERPLISTGGS